MAGELDAAADRLDILHTHLVAERATPDLLPMNEQAVHVCRESMQKLISSCVRDGELDSEAYLMADAIRENIEELMRVRYRKLILCRSVPASTMAAEARFITAFTDARACLEKEWCQ